MADDEKTPNEQIREYISLYLASYNANYNGDEFEIKFGTNPYNQITKIDFDNIIQKLKSLNFTCVNDSGDYTLNIINEYADPLTGRIKDSNIRTTISGISNIQKYCRENMIYEDKLQNIEFLQKFRKRASRDEPPLRPIDFRDFQFRVNYKSERNLTPSSSSTNIKPEILQLLDNWRDSRKIFRFIKRYTFVHQDTINYPFKFDISIVKTNKQRKLHNKRKIFIKEYSIADANVFNEPENYEIEMELLNSHAKVPENTLDVLHNKIKRGIKYILSGWQQTNFPISYTNQKVVLDEYMVLIHGKDNLPKNKEGKLRNAHSGDFIGPSSVSLEMRNIMPVDIDSSAPNINKPYTVTDKADGERKLLFINNTGKMYLIDTNMKVQFTGNITKHKNCCNTIIDGEHVLNDKNGNFINLFLSFDIYFKNKENTKGFPFIKIPGGESKYENNDIPKDKYRGNELNTLINELDSICVVNTYTTPLNVKMKTFYSNIDSNIFQQCKKILDGQREGLLFNYETDGLIFTPCDKSVGSSKVGEITKSKKTRWDYSLKWKPPEFNTIDFLVKTKKDENKQDIIGNIFTDGNNLTSYDKLNQYKTLILHVGFDESKHGFINPCDDVYNDKIPDSKGKNSYKAMPFIPYEPMPSYPIHTTNIILKNFGGDKKLFTEDNKTIFEDDMVVEFRWEQTMKRGWQWIPIRVRYDKTSEYQRKGRITCNAYTTAEGVWRSINKPITEHIISTGLDIPDTLDDNIYYDRTSNETNTKSLRDFHNRYVKRNLIKNVSKRGNTLIDMSVGMGGDLQKWIDSKLSFVFGIDYSKDNIQNRLKGVCARYLRAKKKYRVLPKALFIQGNSALNIKSGLCCFSEKGKQIIQALNGFGPKDEGLLGTGVYKQYGVAKNGFDIISNQFSIHYFFENKNTFYNFVRNLNENCKIGGYFIGTCYDGKRVFQKLKDKNLGESTFILNENETKMWDIKKLYSQNEFPNDENSLGYPVDVYQESINKTFREYLVNFEFFTRVLENYGFVPITTQEANSMGFPQAIGSFEDLFDNMMDDIHNNKLKKFNVGKAYNLTSNEKIISFLNNYFIYKKVRNPNAKEITDNILNITEQEAELSKNQNDELQKTQDKPKTRQVKKYKKKLKLPK
tara:strand:+ start:281 stop:3685 length:3405 start_codon:yes stop_codon:yes gene_type:complete